MVQFFVIIVYTVANKVIVRNMNYHSLPRALLATSHCALRANTPSALKDFMVANSNALSVTTYPELSVYIIKNSTLDR